MIVASEPADRPEDAPGPSAATPADAAMTLERPYLRTALETTLLLGVGTLWYWRSPSLSDSDLKFDWSSWRSKLMSTNDIVFDANLFDTNAVSHPRAGVAYFQIARGNGLSFGGSFLSAFAASTIWEYLSEFIEKPSLNDLIFTPVAGTVIGEATYRIGRYFASEPETPLNQLGALLFSPVSTLNEWSGGGRARAAATRRRSGPRIWHTFELGVGATRTAFSGGTGRDDAMLALADRIVSQRTYRRPGSDTVTAMPGQWTAMSLRAFLDEDRATGVNFHAHVLVWGRYMRDYVDVDGAQESGADAAPAPAVEPEGWGFLYGLGSTFDYDSRMIPSFRDRTASVGLVGPMVELDRRRGNMALRATLASRYGLAMVQSLAYPQVAALLDGETIKSSLRDQGYYYAHGIMSTASLAVAWSRVELAVLGRLDAFWSIEGRDRFQARLQDDFSLSDRRATLGASISGRPWPAPIRVVTGVERVERVGRLLGESAASSETRATVSAAVAF